MIDLFKRIQVLLSALPTYLVAAVAIITYASEEIAKIAPAGVAEDVTRYAVIVVAVLTGFVNIVRRVSPVAPADRGLLPPAGYSAEPVEPDPAGLHFVEVDPNERPVDDA